MKKKEELKLYGLYKWTKDGLVKVGAITAQGLWAAKDKAKIIAKDLKENIIVKGDEK
jgi:hypothetical protein